MKLAIIGAGMQAEAVCFDLVKQPDLEAILLVDIDAAKAEGIADRIGDPRIKLLVANAGCQNPFLGELKAFKPDALLSTAPYHMNLFLMAAALEVPCHFSDLGGNNDVVAAQKQHSHWAEKLGVSIIPATGMAPGMPGHLLADVMLDFDSVESFTSRVGGIPQKRDGILDYSLVFSIEGLINEYVEKARAIRHGELCEIESMTRLEPIAFDGIGEFEAFVTSGALSTLPDTFAGRIDELNYKTIRWPGHIQFFQRLKRLGMLSSENIDGMVAPRKLFESQAAPVLDTKAPDMILMKTTAMGIKDGAPHIRTYQMVEYPADGLSAMMRATAFPASVVLLMLARGEVPMKGFAPLELSIGPKKFLSELAARGIKIEVTDLPG